MKKRLAYLGCIFAAILGYFLLQKPIFMLYNGACEKGVSFVDYLKVLYHGFTLDAATTGYLTALPWLIILVSIWSRRFPLRKILVGYYALIALATTLVFIGDMALYPFWGFKLDASIFLYLDSPKNAMASVSVGFILIRVLCILILSALLTWGLYKITPAQLPQVPQVRKRLTGSLVTILLGGILFIIIRGGVTESTSNVGQAYFCDNEFLNHSAVNPDFSLLSSISKTTDFAKQFNFFDEETGQPVRRVVCRHRRKHSILVEYSAPQRTDCPDGELRRRVCGIIGRPSECQPQPGTTEQGGSLFHELLRQQFPHRPRHGLHLQRLPEFPYRVGHEVTGQEPYAAFHCREAAGARLCHRLSVRG